MGLPSLSLFRSLAVLRFLNVLGVGLAMSALTGAAVGHLLSVSNFSNASALSSALPTLLIGAFWAWLLRVAARSSGRAVWAWSVPLAILNTALAGASLSVYGEGLIRALLQTVPFLLISATIGVVFWVPAMLSVLVLFGAPIAWARGLARRGLAGEERGELIVGTAVLLLSLAGLFLTVHRPPSNDINWMSSVSGDFLERGMDVPTQYPSSFCLPDSPATALLFALGALGAAAGVVAAGLAFRRDRHRRHFVAEVEAGRVAGYRVDHTAEGRVLVRFARGEQAYRSADEDEELFAIEEWLSGVPGATQESGS